MLRDVDRSCDMCGFSFGPKPGYPPPMRITSTDISLARNVGAGVIVGKAFAFIGPDAFKSPGLAWVARLIGPASPARIVPPPAPTWPRPTSPR
jgi:hypothetical protein